MTQLTDEEAKKHCALKIVGWIHEDELPAGYPYDDMFPYSKVDIVRLFPVYMPCEATK